MAKRTSINGKKFFFFFFIFKIFFLHYFFFLKKGVALGSSTESEREEIGKDVQEGIFDGSYSPVVAKTYALKDASQAHFDIINTTSSKGKLVLLPWEN